jgi:hypothetical protein
MTKNTPHGVFLHSVPALRSASIAVDLGRKTYDRLKEYLERFWGYYQSTHALQKALVTV